MSKKITVLALSLGLGSCQQAKDVAAALVCGSAHSKGQMTLGLNFDYFKGLGVASSDDGAISDNKLQDYMNDALGTANISSSILSVDKVESMAEGDKFRFLSLGGAFGAGFGVATSLVKKAFSSSSLQGDESLMTASSPFDFINESFSVNAADFEVVDDATPYKDQWSMSQTQFDDAMELIKKIRSQNANANDKPIVVAILDTGVDDGHPDLKDIMVEGSDFMNEGGTMDENGHGTHCAGIVAGQAKSSAGVLGVAGRINVRIMPIKVLGKAGGGSFQAIEKGIRYATDRNVDVISMSLGAGLEWADLNKSSKPLANAIIKEAIDKGIIVIAAAGNEGCELGGKCEKPGVVSGKKFSEYTVLPCAYEGSICIGATNADETLANYSNYSSDKKSSSYRTKADMNAPGTAIYSSWPRSLGKNYNTISGTSMATPFVAGMAALFKWADRNVNQAKFLDYLKRGAAKPKDIVDKSGVGRADLYASSVAFANAASLADAPAEEAPPSKPVEAPKSDKGESGDDLISSLWGAACSL